MVALPLTPRVAPTPAEAEVGLFLLNETNRAYLLGTRRLPDIPSPAHAPILLMAALNLFLTEIDFSLHPAMVAVRLGALTLLAASVARTGYDHYRRRATGRLCGGAVVDYDEQYPAGKGAGEVPLVRIAFRFTSPGGIVLYGWAGGDSRFATAPHAPLPGTPVLVWYVSDAGYWLL